MSTVRLLMRVTAIAGLLVLITSCVTPARNDAQYQGKASAAVQAASGNVATGLLIVQQQRAHQVLRTYADEVVTAAETAIGSVIDAFGSVQPPDQAADHVRDAVTDVLSQAEDALGHARIAVRRADPAALDRSQAELQSVAAALDTAAQDLR